MSAPLRELADAIGDHRVGVHPADLGRHATDWSPAALLAKRSGTRIGLPLAVARPRSTEHVSAIVAWAQRTGTPCVPFGGGSGVCEAIVPERALVLEMRAMDEVIDFDEKSRLVRVQPGVTGPQITGELKAWGYTLGHEPQSLQMSTVGGWVATRACGQLSARYGGIESMIAGLHAVLPTGEVALGKTTPRSAAGPDVASLMIGSEGTLGVVTEITLRVHPLEAERVDRAVRFEHMADGVAACRALAQSDLAPTLVRLYDADDVGLFLRNHPDEPRAPLLLLSFEGRDAEGRAAAAADLIGGSDAPVALVEHWWAHRNDAVKEFEKVMSGNGLLGPHALVETMEVSGTWSVLRQLYHTVKAELAEKADFIGCHISHVYPDGACLYFTLGSACNDDPAAYAKLEEWWDAGMRACLSAGGSISHHHGVGRRKARWLPEELGGWFEALRRIKRALDPAGVMNPGALGL